MLVFPAPRSTENYAMKYPAIRSNLSQLSLCFFTKVADQGLQAIVSYAKLDDNDFYVQIYPTEVAVAINNEKHRYILFDFLKIGSMMKVNSTFFNDFSLP